MGQATELRRTNLTIVPTEIVAGISYHLIQLGLAVRVSRRSIQSTTARLRKDDLSLIVNRIDWRNLTDVERLIVLANETGTAIKVNRGVATLREELYGG